MIKKVFLILFFQLNSGEQALYNRFLQERAELERKVEAAQRQMNPERQRGEEEIQNLFRELISPYMTCCRLEVASCFATYGDNAGIMVQTPVYVLFREKEPFDVAYQVCLWFSTNQEVLSSHSRLRYVAKSGESLAKKAVINDLIRKIIDVDGDGITKPMLKFRGDGLYFASTEFAPHLLMFIRKMLGVLGKECIEELQILLREYFNQCSREEYSDTTIQKRVFKEAYETKLEQELIKSGFKEYKPELLS